jgi:septal ring factor EnvC (AmiA/AmiB activator)
MISKTTSQIQTIYKQYRTGENMPKVSISEAIRMTGISRSHFYNKYISKGLISLIVEEDKKMIDTSELIRVFGNIQVENKEKEQLRTTQDIKNTAEKDKIIELLEKQLEESKAREREAKEREEWLQKQIDELRQQQNNLLENKQPKRKKFLGVF